MWSVIGYSLLALLGLILLTLLSPLVARIRYVNEELTVSVMLFGIPVWRYSSEAPKKEKKKKKAKKKASSSETPKEEKKEDGLLDDLAKTFKKDGVRAVIQEIERFVKLAEGVARPFVRVIAVDKLRIHVVVASADASATAQNVGRICAVLYPAVTALQSVIKIRRRAVTVVPDFLAVSGSLMADAVLHGMVIRVLWAALCALLVYFKFKSETEEDVQNGQQAE